MKSTIVIKQIYNDYCSRIIDLILPIQQIEFNVPVTLEAQPDLLDIEINYYKDGGGFWGALDLDQLVGTIGLINVGYNTGVIRKMFVKKDFRGKELGIAQNLLETLITHCKKLDITDVYLGTVDTLKAAHRFYEKNNFIKIDVKQLPAHFPRMMADNVFYRLNLTQHFLNYNGI